MLQEIINETLAQNAKTDVITGRQAVLTRFRNLVREDLVEVVGPQRRNETVDQSLRSSLWCRIGEIYSMVSLWRYHDEARVREDTEKIREILTACKQVQEALLTERSEIRVTHDGCNTLVTHVWPNGHTIGFWR